ncbi:MAG: helix-turn-helix domain-containing protein, partial [Candidatus Rokubacteria bacterium]|nr:helix-turn-helix domain-containing protein [Candidatus Rokubacteria bacterium]
MESSIGQRLREARETLGHTVETVSAKTGLAARFILAAEKTNFREFGGRLYWEKYGRAYAEFLGIYDENFRDDMIREWETYAFRDALRFQKPAWWRRMAPNLRPRHNVFVLSALIGLGILSYFGYQLSFLISSPKLII